MLPGWVKPGVFIHAALFAQDTQCYPFPLVLKPKLGLLLENKVGGGPKYMSGLSSVYFLK